MAEEAQALPELSPAKETEDVPSTVQAEDPASEMTLPGKPV